MSIPLTNPGADALSDKVQTQNEGSPRRAGSPVQRRKSKRLSNQIRKNGKTITLRQKIRRASTTESFPFILVTEGPRSREDSRLVRSHAMHHYIARSKSLEAPDKLRTKIVTGTSEFSVLKGEEATERSHLVSSAVSTATIDSVPSAQSSGTPWTHSFLISAAGPLSVLAGQEKPGSETQTAGAVLTIEMQSRFNRYLHHFALINHEASGNIGGFLGCWGGLIARDAILFHAIIGLCANQISCMMYGVDVERHQSSLPVESLDGLACKSKAMQQIRNAIDRQQLDLDIAIAAVGFLALSEAISFANHAVASVHMSAIAQFIALRGGIEFLPVYALRCAVGADLKVCSLTLSAPTIYYDFGTETHDLIQSMVEGNRGNLAITFEWHAWHLASSTLSLIEDLRDFTIFKWHIPATLTDLSLISAGNYEKCAIEHRLLTYTASRGADGSIDRCIHASLLMYLNTIAWLSFPAQSMISQVLAGHLQDAMQHCSWPPMSQEIVSLQLWTSILALSVVQAEDQKEWFRARVVKFVQDLDIKEVEDLKEMLESYLYVERVYGPSVDRIWHFVAGK